MDLFLGKQRVRISPQMAIGKGGEADIYDLGGGRALKLFKTEQHPDLAGQPQQQSAARALLALQQDKLPAFPRALPASVIAPDELALDARGQIAGYAMRLVPDAEPLLRYGEPAFRRAGATSAQVAALFRALHQTFTGLHHAGVLIGDVNDLNILIPGSGTSAGAALVIDADSFQFGRFPCLAFTERFLDPRLAGPGAQQLFPTLPYDFASDWFAFAALLVQSLLLVGPWGGMHRPAAPAKAVPPPRRALERVSIFRDQLQLPPSALPRDSLPDELLHELAAIFERDERRPFPQPLLDGLTFRDCPGCKLEHARPACPRCRPHAASPVQNVATANGTVFARTLFESPGAILAAALEPSGPRDLHGAARAPRPLILHHDGQGYRREDGRLLLTGPRDPRLRFGLLGETTLVGRGGKLMLLSTHAPPRALQADLCEGAPTFAAHGTRLVWSSGAQLLSADAASLTPGPGSAGLQLPPLVIGALLGQGTRLWLGPEFGLGLTRAGELTQLFSFSPGSRGLDDSLRLPRLAGTLLATRCAFAHERAWLFLALRQQQRTVHRAVLLDRAGKLLAECEAEEDDGSWLGQLPNLCAAGELLFAATDAGLLRLEAFHGRIEPRRHFADTAPFVDRETQLFLLPDGLLAVGARYARALRIQ